MNDGSLIDVGALAKPATVLIKKVSAAIGVLYQPTRIRKEARAKADAAIVEAQTRIQIGELERRAMTRFVIEQTREQKNIEDITSKALPYLEEDSDPSRMDEDWINDFFAKCRRISNHEMQVLWARLLAGEANSPGTVSKRTVDFVAAMDKSDAEIFARICRFSCNSLNETLIFKTTDPILVQNKITWSDLSHMETIGLIKLSPSEILGGFIRKNLPEVFSITVGDEIMLVKFNQGLENRAISTGIVILSRTGRELRRFVSFEPPKGFSDYCVENWSKDGRFSLSGPYPRLSTAEMGGQKQSV